MQSSAGKLSLQSLKLAGGDEIYESFGEREGWVIY